MAVKKKPEPPYPGFPLFAHPAGQWVKKIRGKLYYFGPWSNPSAAVAAYQKDADRLHAGFGKSPTHSQHSVRDALNAFLTAQEAKVNGGELSRKSYERYKWTTDLLNGHFGAKMPLENITPLDFIGLREQLTKRVATGSMATYIACCKAVFHFAYENELIEKPIRYGDNFRPPTKRTLRLLKLNQKPFLFTADECRRLINASSPNMKAMILLGLNCGFGPQDCCTLLRREISLKTGTLKKCRNKTGTDRIIPLWPQTLEAIVQLWAKKRESKYAFTTQYGGAYSDNCSVRIARQFLKLRTKAGIKDAKGERRRTFYCLRHTFATVAKGAGDRNAVQMILGHVEGDSTEFYDGHADLTQARKVTEFVRSWLFNSASSESPASASEEEEVAKSVEKPKRRQCRSDKSDRSVE